MRNRAHTAFVTTSDFRLAQPSSPPANLSVSSAPLALNTKAGATCEELLRLMTVYLFKNNFVRALKKTIRIILTYNVRVVDNCCSPRFLTVSRAVIDGHQILGVSHHSFVATTTGSVESNDDCSPLGNNLLAVTRIIAEQDHSCHHQVPSGSVAGRWVKGTEGETL